jgi:hypothetical protein
MGLAGEQLLQSVRQRERRLDRLHRTASRRERQHAADPLFCNLATSDFHLAETSPCAPAQTGSCGLIGRFDVACAGAVEMTNWGAIKASYGR